MKNNIKTFNEGKDLWYYYVKINGYSFKPNQKGLLKISKDLDLNKPYIEKLINYYLST